MDLAVVTPVIAYFGNTNAISMPQQRSANGSCLLIQDYGFIIFLIMMKYHD